MSKSMFVLGGMASALLLASVGPPAASELAVPEGPAYAAPLNCGPCGCLTVRYVYHRRLESTYGLSFDPRNYDQTVPHYFLGPVRGYPRYLVNGVPVHRPCWY